MNELLVSFKTTRDFASTCIKSVNLEAEADRHMRSKVRLKYEGGRLIIEIKALDLTSMRAALNTYLRWVMMCEGLIEKKT